MKIRTVILGVLLINGVACQKAAEYDYKNNAQSVDAMQVPPELNHVRGPSYYPIPANLTFKLGQQKSLLPPDSHISEYRERHLKKSPTTTSSSIYEQELPTGQKVLVLSYPFEQSWGLLGTALAVAHYKVLQQEEEKGAYLIQGANANRYWIQLTAQGNSTQVSVLDAQKERLSKTAESIVLNHIKMHLH